MKKNKRSMRETAAGAENLPIEGISRRGKGAIVGGIVLLALGFAVLSKADSLGKNWAATLAPFMILGAYLTIGIGIFIPDPSEQPSDLLPTSPR